MENLTLNNVAVAKKYIKVPADQTLMVGASTLHAELEIVDMVTSAFELTEGMIKEVIAGVISTLGYSPTTQMINDSFNNVIEVMQRSVFAQASLIKIWQIQSGQELTDVFGNRMNAILFGPKGNIQITESNNLGLDWTVFQKNISNAEWEKNYVGKMQYTYTTPTLSATVLALFMPIFELNKGYQGYTTYANLWPKDFLGPDYNTQSVNDKFLGAVQAIVDLTTSDPYLVQILVALGFKSGFDFDFKRALDGKSLPLSPDNGLIETLLAFGESYGVPGEEEIEHEFLSSFLYLDDNTPVEVTPSVNIDAISLINAVRGHVQIMNVCFSEQSITNSGVSNYAVYQEAYVANMILDANGTFTSAQSQTLFDLARRIAKQTALVDLDHQHGHHITANYDTNKWVFNIDKIFIYAGYGTFVLDSSSLKLAAQNSSTALVFGVEYKTNFAKLLNSLPRNIVSFT